MAVDRRLLEILVCPITKQPVERLSKDRLGVLNREIEGGNIRNQAGSAIDAPLSDALITSDGRTIYPVNDDVPVMLEDAAIMANQVPGW